MCVWSNDRSFEKNERVIGFRAEWKKDEENWKFTKIPKINGSRAR